MDSKSDCIKLHNVMYIGLSHFKITLGYKINYYTFLESSAMCEQRYICFNVLKLMKTNYAYIQCRAIVFSIYTFCTNKFLDNN